MQMAATHHLSPQDAPYAHTLPSAHNTPTHTTHLQGMLKMIPSSMPYGLPSVHTAVEKQSPGAVGTTKLRMASATDTAVLAALLRPHFLIRAPPRWATVGVNSSLNHFMSCTAQDTAHIIAHNTARHSRAAQHEGMVVV